MPSTRWRFMSREARTDLGQHKRPGYVTPVERVVDGKVQKYYAITKAGKLALTDACAEIRELVEEVLEPGKPRKRTATPHSRQARQAGVDTDRLDGDAA